MNLSRTIRRAAVAAVAAGTMVGAVSTSASADDGSGACVTRYEYSQVRREMTRAQVAWIFGTDGRLTYDAAPYAINREYKTCRRWSWVGITFSRWSRWLPYRVNTKLAVWS